MPFSKIFNVVYVNNILSVNQMAITSISNSYKQLYLEWMLFFSRRLFKHFKPRSPWKWFEWHQLLLFGVLKDRFVAGLAGLVPAHIPWSHFL